MFKSFVMIGLVATVALIGGSDRDASAQAPPSAPKEKKKKDKPDYPPFDEVIDGMEKVVSTTDGSSPLFEVYKNEKTGKLIAALPSKFDSDLYMVASTISGGDSNAGVMGPTHFIKWKKINKQIAIIEPNLYVRTDGDKQAKDSMEGLYTGRVLTSLPILTMTSDKRPVVDIGLLGKSKVNKFFWYGPLPPGRGLVGGSAAKLAVLTKAKAFPKNIIFEYELPRKNGTLIRVTQSISKLEGTPGYKTRNADPRVGYFYDFHLDYARTAQEDITTRHISRWHLEKADPELELSPPKQPIVWYVEHTTPIRFRRYVRDGILWWNNAFREVGIDNAMEVYQQDAQSGAHMDKDPEDARYNFFRWNASEQRYAIGPSRSNPLTGEILDADVVWHQGLTRSIRGMLERVTEDFVQNSFGPETLAWFDEHPSWDPRVRLASPVRRAKVLQTRAAEAKKAATLDLHADDHPWMRGSRSEARNTACRMGNMLALEIGLAHAVFTAGMAETDDVEMLDGLPEKYIGPMIRYISAHEVGHCLGLQHNMAASSAKSLKELNTPGFSGPATASVMDYNSPNVRHEIGEVQGPYVTDQLGDYDKWAIAYGYGPEDELKDVLAKVNEPANLFISQLAIFFGSDPRNNTWDMGADSLNFAGERLGLVRELRETIVEKQVKEGESWKKARRKLSMLNGVHVSALYLASVWVGGSYINNNFKGDPDEQPPNRDIPGEKQRKALQLIMDNAFEDDAYGITPELLRHMGREYWWDPEEFTAIDPSYPVHDLVGGIQATALTMIMNPTKLRRVYDNEFRAADSKDVLTLAEVMTSITDRVWEECSKSARGSFSAKSPMISGFRRNLQREHVERLMDLMLLHNATSPSLRTVGTLASYELTRIDESTQKALKGNPDAYTEAHLTDIQTRIAKAKDAAYVIQQ